MHRDRCRRGLVCLAVAVCLAGPLCPARAQQTEERDYVIYVDDKQAGSSMLKIAQMKDGTVEVSASARVKVKLLVFNAFMYSVDSHETWKDGRLVALKSSATENGKTTDVDVTASNGQLRVRVNGGEGVNHRPELWTSSYWKLADARFHNKEVPILDVDTGKELVGKLQYVGTEPIKIGAKADDCYHFRVIGIPVPIELWFDRYHRLVRQEFVESNHRTIVILNAVRR